jgi:serine/threonine protein kinase
VELVPGAEVERYMVVTRSGAGRMSTTYSVRHTTLGTLHTLLVPNEPKAGLLKRMVAGAKIQARLRHPGIVSVTDVLQLNGAPALVLDHVEGPTLEQFVDSHDMDEKSVDALAIGMFDAVGWLHANSIVHRHLKPPNIMVDLGGSVVVPRITDFTLARVVTGVAKKRKKPRVFGTASFMSPEQTRNSDLVGPQGDIWSLACMLYFLCTGELAFSGDTTEETFDVIRRGYYMPVNRLVPSAPRRWKHAIASALLVEPGHRVANAEEMADLWFEGANERPVMSAKTAPVGHLALVFTDIQGSTRIWESDEDVARHSLRAHDAVMRSSLNRFGGYEVKTEGDAFMIAFNNSTRAIRFCVDVQRRLHEHPWSAELLALPEAQPAPGFRGMRVRMGVHVGVPEARFQKSHADYYGPMVNRAARISGAGHGGQIIVSGEAWRSASGNFKKDVVATVMGNYKLRGLFDTQELIQVLPNDLTERSFPPIKAEAV